MMTDVSYTTSFPSFFRGSYDVSRAPPVDLRGDLDKTLAVASSAVGETTTFVSGGWVTVDKLLFDNAKTRELDAAVRRIAAMAGPLTATIAKDEAARDARDARLLARIQELEARERSLAAAVSFLSEKLNDIVSASQGLPAEPHPPSSLFGSVKTNTGIVDWPRP